MISSESIDSQDFGDAYEKQRRNALKDMKPVATVQLQPMKISAYIYIYSTRVRSWTF